MSAYDTQLLVVSVENEFKHAVPVAMCLGPERSSTYSALFRALLRAVPKWKPRVLVSDLQDSPWIGLLHALHSERQDENFEEGKNLFLCYCRWHVVRAVCKAFNKLKAVEEECITDKEDRAHGLEVPGNGSPTSLGGFSDDLKHLKVKEEAMKEKDLKKVSLKRLKMAILYFDQCVRARTKDDFLGFRDRLKLTLTTSPFQPVRDLWGSYLRR